MVILDLWISVVKVDYRTHRMSLKAPVVKNPNCPLRVPIGMMILSIKYVIPSNTAYQELETHRSHATRYIKSNFL
jgi:hypothetical protein